MREKGQTEVTKTLETPVFSRGIEILTEKIEFSSEAKSFSGDFGACFVPNPVLYHPSSKTDGTPEIIPFNDVPVVRREIWLSPHLSLDSIS